MNIQQNIAILIDGNNIEIEAKRKYGNTAILDYDLFIPEILKERHLTKFFYFKEGNSISEKFADRLSKNFFGIVQACGKSADCHLTISAIQISDKVDTIIIFSGDEDYIPLIKFLRIKGIRIEIVCHESCFSPKLKNEVDYITFLEKSNFKTLIKY